MNSADSLCGDPCNRDEHGLLVLGGTGFGSGAECVPLGDTSYGLVASLP